MVVNYISDLVHPNLKGSIVLVRFAIVRVRVKVNSQNHWEMIYCTCSLSSHIHVDIVGSCVEGVYHLDLTRQEWSGELLLIPSVLVALTYKFEYMTPEIWNIPACSTIFVSKDVLVLYRNNFVKVPKR